VARMAYPSSRYVCILCASVLNFCVDSMTIRCKHGRDNGIFCSQQIRHGWVHLYWVALRVLTTSLRAPFRIATSAFRPDIDVHRCFIFAARETYVSSTARGYDIFLRLPSCEIPTECASFTSDDTNIICVAIVSISLSSRLPPTVVLGVKFYTSMSPARASLCCICHCTRLLHERRHKYSLCCVAPPSCGRYAGLQHNIISRLAVTPGPAIDITSPSTPAQPIVL